MKAFLKRLAAEPPFRILARSVLKRLPTSLETRSKWELSKRPEYLIGLVEAAKQAAKQGHQRISAIEFGVAGGNGLIALQEDAQTVEDATGIEIQVYGFDMGAEGLPPLIGDYRDHPDAWSRGDYKMDEEKLRRRLAARTTLILGDVKETVRAFFKDYSPPTIGFISFDMDLYSSTADALKILTDADTKMLWNTPLYFDDIEFVFNHKFAGELLAIREFNEENEKIKIDRWYGITLGRPFPERGIYKKMYVAHDLESISNATLRREAAKAPLAG